MNYCKSVIYNYTIRTMITSIIVGNHFTENYRDHQDQRFRTNTWSFTKHAVLNAEFRNSTPAEQNEKSSSFEINNEL